MPPSLGFPRPERRVFFSNAVPVDDQGGIHCGDPMSVLKSVRGVYLQPNFRNRVESSPVDSPLLNNNKNNNVGIQNLAVAAFWF